MPNEFFYDGVVAAHAQANSNHVSGQDTSSYVLGVDIGGTNLRLALADMEGTVRARWACSTVGVREAETVVQKTRDGLQAMLKEVSAQPGALKAVAAGAPGITNAEAGVVIATSYLMGWRNVPLQRMLEDELQVPAAIDNDVNLAALGESWRGSAKGISDFAFLAIGTGIGAGIFLNGRLYRGHNWTAGEIGYMLVPGAPAEGKRPNEPGILEATIGGEGIRQHWEACADRTLPASLTATQIFDHACKGDPAARALLVHTSRLLARAIYNISLVLDLPLCVLGGTVGMHEALLEATLEELAALNLRNQPRLLRSIFGPEAQITGALCLALDTAGALAPID